jgi:hypothetical protein
MGDVDTDSESEYFETLNILKANSHHHRLLGLVQSYFVEAILEAQALACQKVAVAVLVVVPLHWVAGA